MSFIHSIKFRFTLWYLLVLAALLIALSAGVYLYRLQLPGWSKTKKMTFLK